MSHKPKQLSKSRIALMVVLALFVLGGSWLLSQSHAATPYIAISPDTGLIQPPATKITDATAANGAAVKFGPAVSTSPSGEPMPTTNIDGFTYAWGEDFTSNAPLGTFRTAYANSWCGYDETAQYSTNKVIYAHDGVMDFKLSGSNGAAGSFGPPNLCHGNVYGRYSMRIKATNANYNGTAVSVWPGTNVWGDGELDYPEGNFDKTITLNHHIMNCTDCSAKDAQIDTGISWRNWHTVTTEWQPGSVKYYLDGKLLTTVTKDVPIVAHRYTIQMGPNSSDPATLIPQAGDFQIDWVAIWTKP